ncbi:MAG: glutaredoxin family protein [Deltaproteobacteria bacterium]|nr:glutaredoxin family protein [Deltaproteobacteria bacterium]
MAKLTLYTRKECCLCEEMKKVVWKVAAEFALGVDEVDVDGAVELRQQYGEEVPVLLINDRRAFKYRVTAGELRKKLRREAVSHPAGSKR